MSPVPDSGWRRSRSPSRARRQRRLAELRKRDATGARGSGVGSLWADRESPAPSGREKNREASGLFGRLRKADPRLIFLLAALAYFLWTQLRMFRLI